MNDGEFFKFPKEINEPGPEYQSFGETKASAKKKKRTIKKMTFLLAAGISFLPVGVQSCGLTNETPQEYYETDGLNTDVDLNM